MKHISLRIDQDLYDKIEECRGNTDRTQYIRDAIKAQVEAQRSTNEAQSDTLVAHMQNVINYLQEENKRLMELLHESQVLQLQAQRQLIPVPREMTKKPWWLFWKK